MARPKRLPGISYTGPAAYFVTTCTLNRRKVFADIDFGRHCASGLLAYSARFNFDVDAYCLMPDHAHVLFAATADHAPLRELVKLWKQVTGFRWHRATGGRLWQEGYFERILRDDEPELSVARYIVENPVRAGLAVSVSDYPLTGSSRYSVAQIAMAVQMGCVRWRRS